MPFQEEEFAALRALDVEKGLPEWVPPEPIHPNFWELLKTLTEEGGPSEVSEVVSKITPEVIFGVTSEPDPSPVPPVACSSEPPSGT